MRSQMQMSKYFLIIEVIVGCLFTTKFYNRISLYIFSMAQRIFKSQKVLSIVLGQCVPSVKSQASKIRIRRMELDENLLMYFKTDSYVYAHDPNKLLKSGDIVLLKEMPERLSKQITHTIEKIVLKFGDITDPITGKNVVVNQYREQMDAINEAYGKCDSGFDYDKAPPRGRLEGIRDFSHQETYIKWHEDGKDQPFAV